MTRKKCSDVLPSRALSPYLHVLNGCESATPYVGPILLLAISFLSSQTPPASNPFPASPPCGFLRYLWRAQGGKRCQGFLYAGPHLHDGGSVGASNSPARLLLILPRYEVGLPISLSPVSLSSGFLVPSIALSLIWPAVRSFTQPLQLLPSTVCL